MTGRKCVAFLCCAAVITGMIGVSGLTSRTTMAVVDKKIGSVYLTVNGNIQVGDSIQSQQVDVTPGNDRYSVGDGEFLNPGFSWNESDVPQLKFRVYAEDGYRFAVDKSKIQIKGGTLLNMEREDSYHTLVLTVGLPSLMEQNSPIAQAGWSSLTVGLWSQSTGAGSYEVRLYRDGAGVGTTKVVEGTSYDFSNAMTKVGTYSYWVRPVNRVKPENKGEWVKSAAQTIDTRTAVSILQKNEVKGKWLRNETGWWYSNGDGSYPVSCWQQINGSWYFFNAQGYMETGWVDWNGKRYYCDLVNGNMLVNETTPDGYRVGSDGAMVGDGTNTGNDK